MGGAATRHGRERVPQLVVLRALGIGDLLTAVPALRALADEFPGYRRVLLAPPKLSALSLLTGAVDAVVPPAAGPLRNLLGAGASICVNLQNNQPAAYRLLLAARPSRLIGFHHPDVAETRGFPALIPGEHEVRRWCRLLQESGIAADPRCLDLPPPLVPALDRGHGATLLHPGASDPVRRWPLDRWAAVARAEVAGGRPILITGSAEEVDAARSICAQAGIDHDETWAGGTDVVHLAGLVSVAARTVSGDTGVAHMATALRTPSVVLFGPKHPPARWGPPPDRPWHRVLWHDPADHPDLGIDGITVDEVLAALDGLPPADRTRKRHRYDRAP